jgi:tetratricopeptide (TPR) repeat protein
VELDPKYVVAYNDLGIIYEALGVVGRAEESYLKAIQTDPHYLSSYSNLALLYENQRNLDKAALYWEKRLKLGSATGDPWATKARQRLNDIYMAEKGIPYETASGLMSDVVNERISKEIDNQEFARIRFQRAKLCYGEGDEVTAMKEAIDASLLDPANSEIQEFIEKLQTRVLTR